MPESNYAALGEGLKLYTDTMRQFLHDRLREKSQQGWWENYVLRALTRGQRDGLTRAMERDPDKDRRDFLDAGHFVQIVTKNFDGPLEGGFHDFNKTRSLLQQVATARNEWAHPRSGDHLAADVAHALYAMREILTTAGLPEAEQVESLRMEVLDMPADGGDGTPEAGAADREIRPAGAGRAAVLVAGVRASRRLPEPGDDRRISFRSDPRRCPLRLSARRVPEPKHVLRAHVLHGEPDADDPRHREPDGAR